MQENFVRDLLLARKAPPIRARKPEFLLYHRAKLRVCVSDNTTTLNKQIEAHMIER